MHSTILEPRKPLIESTISTLIEFSGFDKCFHHNNFSNVKPFDCRKNPKRSIERVRDVTVVNIISLNLKSHLNVYNSILSLLNSWLSWCTSSCQWSLIACFIRWFNTTWRTHSASYFELIANRWTYTVCNCFYNTTLCYEI